MSVAGLTLLATGTTRPAAGGEETIRFLQVSPPADRHLLDHDGDRRPSIGDELARTAELYRWDGQTRGERLGRLVMSCVLAARNGGNCRATVFLPSGTIQAQGYTDFDEADREVAVVGGTGAFTDARGTFRSQTVGGARSPRADGRIRLLR